MKLESLKITNFKAFQNVCLTDLPNFMVFVGANGTGKTTLFDVFGFLKDALKDTASVAVERRGGWAEVVSRGHEKEAISFEIKFRLMVNKKNRLITYFLELQQDKHKVRVSQEYIQYKRGSYGSPYKYFSLKDGVGEVVSNEADFDKPTETLHRATEELDSKDTLALKAFGQVKRFKAANAFKTLIEGWHVSDFYVDHARHSSEVGLAEHLSERGDNIPLVCRYMEEEHPQLFSEMLQHITKRIPGIESVTTEKTIEGRLVLTFKDAAFSNPFVAKWVSDGTLKMFAYLLLLYDPHPHPLLCVEEPENQLYPSLLTTLAEEFQAYCSYSPKKSLDGFGQRQVMVSTHSPDFLNAVNLESLFFLQKKNGFTTIKRAEEDSTLKALFKEGNRLGYLWSHEYIEGVDPA